MSGSGIPPDTTDEATRTLRTEEAGAAPSARPPSSASLDGARFAPGAILAGRYRLVAMLGRGGMGEVYRAEDLKLGEPVAVKFLPEELTFDGAALARFHREVRVARQIAHRNVCRVHDIGEAEGFHFLTMEYIDGEDLASLLRRIGRLPQDKAVELAGQICRGLAAAHDAGVLHRDLKPANVMIDGKGRAKITDFGLAHLQEELREHDRDHFAGTPAYMAPEQLRGGELSPRSDIYALGLVLYEMFTGDKPFPEEDWRRLVARGGRDQAPADPSSRVEGLDPAVRTALLRCLEEEPAKRPSSALAVAASLPGGDPLRAALEAGETPSPQMVAAAREGGMARRWVSAALVATVLLVFANAWLADDRLELHASRVDEHPALYELKARQLLHSLGHSAFDGLAGVDRLWRFNSDFDALRFLADASSDRAELDQHLAAGMPGAVRFVYAERVGPLVPHVEGQMRSEWIGLRPSVGSRVVVLDPRGHLLGLRVQTEPGPAPEGTPDWPAALAATGLDPDELLEVPPRAAPDVRTDAARAWESRPGSGSEADGSEADDPKADGPVRVELAALGDRVVFAQVVGPWTPSDDPDLSAGYAILLFYLLVIVAAIYGAQHHLRAGRADVAGATKLAAFLLFTHFLFLVVSMHWGGPDNAILAFQGLFKAFGKAAILAVLWLALEPTVRRRAPHLLISMTRLLAADWRDARVGRDILLGLLAGSLMGAMARFGGELGPIGGVPWLGHIAEMLSAWLAESTYLALFMALGLTLVFSAIQGRTGRSWPAVLALFAILAATIPMTFPEKLFAAILVACVVGFAGLLPTIVMVAVRELLVFWPLTLDTSAWYFDQTILALFVLGALAAWGWYASIGHEPAQRSA